MKIAKVWCIYITLGIKPKSASKCFFKGNVIGEAPTVILFWNNNPNLFLWGPKPGWPLPYPSELRSLLQIGIVDVTNQHVYN
jgi:hypothetical protein